MTAASPPPSDPGWRTERDSLGTVQVPRDALWGAQTQRAIANFPLSGQPLPERAVRALLHVKAAAAAANGALGLVDADVAAAIGAACRELLGDARLMTHFPVDVFQTGSGTSSNMNANEVLATLAARRAGRPVSANDHVNCSQSSNDVLPSAIHVAAALALARELLPALAHLRATTLAKAATLGAHVKTGRTHLMDAMPVRFDQVLGGWAAQVAQDIALLEGLAAPLHALALGGTAVGTGVNAHPEFAARCCATLAADLGLPFVPAADRFTRIGAQDTAVALSGALKTCAVTLTKLASDLRWMNSGPLAGLAEIELPALQPGSSIMPGKVNPVVPEAVAMAAAQVVANDTAVALAGLSGSFELNVMLPLIARNLLESLQLLAAASRLLADRAIAGFRVNEAGITRALARNPVLATALNPRIGYARAAEIAKAAYAEGRPILDVAAERSGIPRDELERLLDPRRLTEGGLPKGTGEG